MDVKKWYESKILWLAVIGVLTAVSQGLESGVVDPNVIMMGVINAVIAVLRPLSTKKLSK